MSRLAVLPLLLLAGCRQLLGIEDGASVVDADGATVAVGFTAAATTVDEQTGTLAIEVALDDAADSPVTVRYAFRDGSALQGSDYVASDGTLAFAPGEISRTIECTIASDASDEADETFAVELVEATGAVLGATTHEITISALTLPRVSVLGPSSTSPEGQNAQIDLAIDPPSPVPFELRYSVTGSATRDVDFQAPLGTLDIPANVAMAQLTVQIINDALDEDNETVTVTLTGGDGVLVAQPDTRTHTIEDNDPLPNVSFANGGQIAMEGQVVSARVRLSAPSGRTVTVPYSVVATSTAVAADYMIALPSPLTIPAGQQELAVPIQIVEDNDNSEDDELLRLRLEPATNAMVGLSNTFEIDIRK